MTSALDAIIVMDTRGVIQDWNAAAERTFGLPREEAVGRTVAQTVVPPELRDAHWRGLQRYLETGTGKILNRRVEIEGQRSDGQRLTVELTVVPFEADGVRLFAGYLRDLTEKKKAEAAVERANKMALLLRDIPLKASAAGSFLEAAQVALEQVCVFAGWPVGHAYVRDRERDVLRPAGIWYLKDPQRYAAFRKVTDATELALGEGLPGRAWKEERLQWVDDIHLDPGFKRAREAGNLGVCAGMAVPIPVDGKTEAVLEFYTEAPGPPDEHLMRVTEALVHELGRVLERQRDREELRTANQRLAEMAGRRADFLNLAAHELKNPLTPLGLQLQLLRRTGSLSEAQQQSLHIIDRSVARLKEIVEDLLEGARAQSGSLTIEAQNVDLLHVVDDVLDAFKDPAAARGIELRKESVGAADAYADPRRLAQVLDNLVSNALKFTPEGGVVTVRVGREGAQGLLEVEDNGAGIDPDDHHRLFQPFSQVHERSEDLGGTGLGLYVCQAIMEAHGGRMGVRSGGKGQGTLFWAKWPASAQSVHEQA